MNTASKIAKESTITFSGLVYGNINRYLYTALLARWVGPEFLGIYSLANAIMLISEVIAKMGLETGVMRFVSQLNPQIDNAKIQKVIGSALKMTFISSLIIMIALVISSGSIVKMLSESSFLKYVIIIFSIAIPLMRLHLLRLLLHKVLKGLNIKYWLPSLSIQPFFWCPWYYAIGLYLPNRQLWHQCLLWV